MESKNRRTEIRIETHEVKVVRLHKTGVLAICKRCGDVVTARTPEQPAEVLERTQDDLMQKALPTRLINKEKK